MRKEQLSFGGLVLRSLGFLLAPIKEFICVCVSVCACERNCPSSCEQMAMKLDSIYRLCFSLSVSLSILCAVCASDINPEPGWSQLATLYGPVVISAKKVMFSSALVFCLFVRLLAGLRKNNLTDFARIHWKDSWQQNKPLDFGGNVDHDM